MAADTFPVNVDGRTATAVGRLVTPAGPIHNEPVQVKKGDLQVMLTRQPGAIVNAPGQTS
ncbi:hypothetical protein AB0J90_03520 [Micromonospora sp. NPDC049523]|uniref:hypothetical protein n=1 Tax=Micromonospora sp. NPDC049523 TaxID=3155921 RepID=UPI00343740A2